MSARHAPRADRRSRPFERDRARRQEGWEFTSTFSNYPTREDRDHIERTFGILTADEIVESLQNTP